MGLKYEILNPKQIRNHKYQIYEEIRFENPARRVSVVVELARQFVYPAVFFLQSELCHYLRGRRERFIGLKYEILNPKS